MSKTIEELAESLFAVSGSPSQGEPLKISGLQEAYNYFLAICDGGYTADKFFHLFGRQGPVGHNLYEWNRIDLWKQYYSLDRESVVFAENIFGFQYFFDIRGNRKVVKILDPGTGKVSLCANTFEDFVEDEVFSDEFNADDRALARLFAKKNGIDFQPFTHLSCKKPILFGGCGRDLENLEQTDSLINLSLAGQIVSQTKNLPSGSKIDKIKVK